MHRIKKITVSLLCFSSTIISAKTVETVEVYGRSTQLIGEAISASEGYAGQQEIQIRPLLRSGELLELVPGMVVTQHSGTGKANQYFLRGFNLDHGTDFATSLDGMPLNMRSHGHGQGYTDLNPIIPETVSTLNYKKGAYYAEVGDFSGAGGAAFKTLDRPESSTASLSVGEDHYQRALLMGGAQTEGNWLYALELNRYDGPWTDIREDLRKHNALIKYSRNTNAGAWSVSFMGYDNEWNSADQIPRRAVNRGLIDELGSIDDSLGGESSRYSLSMNWQRDQTAVSAYAIRYDFRLWSNFTYFLEDPANGDQFEQVDERIVYGGSTTHDIALQLSTLPAQLRLGAEWRYDDIDEVGLHRSQRRTRLGSVRSDAVDEWSIGLYADLELNLSEKIRAVLGARYDYYDFDVDNRLRSANINSIDLAPNSGSSNDDLLSLKASLVYTLNTHLETYAAIGEGFHSNDARGTTIRVDPGNGTAVDAVDPLVKSLGYEIGVRGNWQDKLNASLAVWALELDSELLFVGDAGATEASGKSKRWGSELTAYYRLTDAWTLDLEYAWTDARFEQGVDREIPGAIEEVVQAGIAFDNTHWFGSLRARFFGERPLIEDNSVRSEESLALNLRAGYRFDKYVVYVDALNLLDSNDHDIDYFYESQLPGESTPVEDIHYHVLEPRTVRLTVSLTL